MKQLQEDNHFSLFQWGNFVNIFFFFFGKTPPSYCEKSYKDYCFFHYLKRYLHGIWMLLVSLKKEKSKLSQLNLTAGRKEGGGAR